jgi:hypothetical protein
VNAACQEILLAFHFGHACYWFVSSALSCRMNLTFPYPLNMTHEAKIEIYKFSPPPKMHKDQRWRQCVSPKRWYLPTRLHGVTTQNNNIVIFTTVRISNFTNVVQLTTHSSFIFAFSLSVIQTVTIKFNSPSSTGTLRFVVRPEIQKLN